MSNRKLGTIYWVIAALLMISALTAVKFSDEFEWDQYDFLIFGVMLLGAGIAIEIVLKATQKAQYRLGLVTVIALVFLLIWVELAVGIFN